MKLAIHLRVNALLKWVETNASRRLGEIWSLCGQSHGLQKQIDGDAEEFGELPGLGLTDAALAVQDLRHTALG